MIRLCPDGPYRIAAVDDFGRTVATAIRNLYGWSLIGREMEQLPSCGGCVVCDPKHEAEWRTPVRSVLRQRTYATLKELRACLARIPYPPTPAPPVPDTG